MSAAADATATATVRRSGREAELLRLPSWCGAAAASLAVCAVWAATTWIALHLRADVTLHTVALFVHLASLVLGLGAVLAIDYYGALWLTGRKTLREVLDFTAPPARTRVGRPRRSALQRCLPPPRSQLTADVRQARPRAAALPQRRPGLRPSPATGRRRRRPGQPPTDDPRCRDSLRFTSRLVGCSRDRLPEQPALITPPRPPEAS